MQRKYSVKIGQLIKGQTSKDLHAKIGQLSMENDFLSVALGRIGDASVKK